MVVSYQEPPVQLKLFEKVKPKPKRECVGRILMLGGGRQSSGLVERSVEGIDPRYDLVLFADTKDEPKYVYDQVAYLKQRLETINTPLVTIEPPQGKGLMETTMTLGQSRYAKMPLYVPDVKHGYRQLPRQCTNEFKIAPCDRYVRQWLFERGHGYKTKKGAVCANRSVFVDVAFGFGADESYRVNRKPFPVGWKRKIFPLYEEGLTTPQLVAWLQQRGLPVAKKSSCIECPYHEDAYWMYLNRELHEDFERVCVFDDFLRTPAAKRSLFRGIRDDVYLHPSCMPLRDVDFEHWKSIRKYNPWQLALLENQSCSMEGGACDS